MFAVYGVRRGVSGALRNNIHVLFSECCCRKPKPVLPLNVESLDPPVMNVNVISNTFASEHHQLHLQQQNPSDSLQTVINYDETEPPPSYALLFPNQKSTEDLSQIATGSHQRAE